MPVRPARPARPRLRRLLPFPPLRSPRRPPLPFSDDQCDSFGNPGRRPVEGPGPSVDFLAHWEGHRSAPAFRCCDRVPLTACRGSAMPSRSLRCLLLLPPLALLLLAVGGLG